ncbi:MAG: ATP-binding cassette domain-containing protein [Candidatus Dadabacteria bacterium]|nr:ABC transporter ATP-binding protein [Candidatus Dadabacteria bacterium]NIV41576.1 ATP-binding cassette domain-containing protein [Candidatus Dadabacteria bacterium]NIX15138.1 ATP-binding cassette domain-containing protein [Candidatus Dadabacteria bacterium]NIY21783.1 ATP-binding cassette domain-containing protein [Candidatus Dadabacteria bacterium]
MILEVQNLVKDFRSGFLRKQISVLKDISFSVEPGEVYGIAGPNGAGKTTAFKCVLGFINPTSGNIKVFGKSPDHYETRKSIGYLPENPYFYEYLSGYELMKYMGEIHGLGGKELNNRISYLLEKVNLTSASNRQLRKYSKGMLQRIGIAQSLINDPEFIILDEPMSGLDPLGRREVRDIILELKKNGKTVILSSHILSDLEALCDKVCFIFGGKSVKSGSIYELYHEIHSDYEAIIKKNSIDLSGLLNIDSIAYEDKNDHVILKFNEKNKNTILGIIQSNKMDLVSIHPLRTSLENVYKQYSEDTQIT